MPSKSKKSKAKKPLPTPEKEGRIDEVSIQGVITENGCTWDDSKDIFDYDSEVWDKTLCAILSQD